MYPTPTIAIILRVYYKQCTIMVDSNYITTNYGQQAEVCETYAREMLKFVTTQQAYLANYLFPHSDIGGLDNQGAKASMFAQIIFSMCEAIEEARKIDDDADINTVVDSAMLVREATKNAYEQLIMAPDSLDGIESDKRQIKIIRVIVNTMLEYSESAFHMAKAAVCITGVVEAVGDAERANAAVR